MESSGLPAARRGKPITGEIEFADENNLVNRDECSLGISERFLLRQGETRDIALNVIVPLFRLFCDFHSKAIRGFFMLEILFAKLFKSTL